MATSSQQSAFQHIDQLFEAQRAYQQEAARTTVSERIRLLKQLRRALEDQQAAVARAIYQDFMKPEAETLLTEIYPLLKEIDHTIAHLAEWMRPRKVRSPLPYLGTRSWIIYEPRGTCLIMAPWNYPFQLAIGPLISALAAGNTVILKPSELAPHTAAFIQQFISELFPPRLVAVVLGGGEVAQYLTQLPFNHIFFTGSPAKGKLVMQAAANHLASVTLELGGKSPAIVTPHADVNLAARRLAWGKFVNSGQTCIAPDYVLVSRTQAAEFLKLLVKYIEHFWGSPEEQAKPGRMTHIVNTGHFNRLTHLIGDARTNGAELIYGGQRDAATRFIAPTVLLNPSDDALVLQEEIFGPVLPVITYTTLEEALSRIRQKPTPLALYIFSQKKAEIQSILQNTRAGSTVINDVMHQFVNSELPFGGMNMSGIGKAHGFYGFKAFSNERSVMKLPRRHAIDLVYPPYTQKVMRLIRLTLKFF